MPVKLFIKVVVFYSRKIATEKTLAIPENLLSKISLLLLDYNLNQSVNQNPTVTGTVKGQLHPFANTLQFQKKTSFYIYSCKTNRTITFRNAEVIT